LKKKEKTELLLLEARIYESMGNHQKAINSMTNPKAVVANQVAKNEQLARLYLGLGDKDKAIDYYEKLLEINSSNQSYYYDILRVHGFTK